MDETLEKLSAAVGHARTHSRFYAGLPETPLTNMSMWLALPYTSVRDIITRGNTMICCSGGKIRRLITSGTSGAQKRLAFSDADIEATIRFFTTSMANLGAAGEITAIFMPGVRQDGVGKLLSMGLSRIGASPLCYGPVSDVESAAMFCRKKHPKILVGMPAQMRRLALTAPDLCPKRVLLSADYMADSVKETISRVWRCEVYNHYGLTESGLGCAVETPERDGLHTRDDVFLETDSDGEIILTTLTREAMPLIRYRTGDMGLLLPDGHIGAIYGRRAELNKPISSYQLDEYLFRCDDILDYTAEIRGDCLNVRVLGSVEAADALLSQAALSMSYIVSPGNGCLSDGTVKRGVAIR